MVAGGHQAIGALTAKDIGLAGEEWRYDRALCIRDFVYSTLGDDSPSFTSGHWPHFYHVVSTTQHPHIVIHHNYAVAIGNQTVHHFHQSVNIGWMKADARFIKHIEDARGLVANGTC